MTKILIAGIGNIFFGDDAFGCEAVKILQKYDLPEGVKLVDYGIKTRDLAYELLENYDLVILLDAVKSGQESGTISLIEIEDKDFIETNRALSHVSKLDEALNFAKTLGADFNKMYLIGCEPENIDVFSETMAESAKKAAEIVADLIPR